MVRTPALFKALSSPNAIFVVPLTTRETRLLFEAAIYRQQAADIPFRLLFGHAQDALGAADVSLVASGTATLEAALIKRPMVITYKIAKFSYWLMKRMAYQPYVGLPPTWRAGPARSSITRSGRASSSFSPRADSRNRRSS